MTLDRSKKYEGLGLTWEHKVAMNQWCGYREGFYLMAHALEDQMQAWLDADHIRPVKETKIVRVENVRIRMRHRVLEITGWDSFAELNNVPEYELAKPVTLEFEVEA